MPGRARSLFMRHAQHYSWLKNRKPYWMSDIARLTMDTAHEKETALILQHDMESASVEAPSQPAEEPVPSSVSSLHAKEDGIDPATVANTSDFSIPTRRVVILMIR